MTRGASCPPGHGLRPCPHHSLRPAGRPGPCSQIQTPSGTLRLPTPSEGALRTAGRKPKTWVPRPRGHQRQGPERAGCSPARPPPWRSLSIHWNRSQASLSSCLGFAQGPRPLLGVRNTTLHRKPSHWMGGLHPPHTPATGGSPDLPAPLGPDTVPSWLGGPGPVSGNCPRGRCRGAGPALEPGPPCPGGHLGPGLSGCLSAAPARAGAMASGSNEAK